MRCNVSFLCDIGFERKKREEEEKEEEE